MPKSKEIWKNLKKFLTNRNAYDMISKLHDERLNGLERDGKS